MTESLLRLPQVKTACGLSRTELYRRIGTGEFPEPVALGKRAVAWRSSQIQDWIAARATKTQPVKVGSHA
jgi:prophage regulatory protein